MDRQRLPLHAVAVSERGEKRRGGVVIVALFHFEIASTALISSRQRRRKADERGGFIETMERASAAASVAEEAYSATAF